MFDMLFCWREGAARRIDYREVFVSRCKNGDSFLPNVWISRNIKICRDTLRYQYSIDLFTSHPFSPVCGNKEVGKFGYPYTTKYATTPREQVHLVYS